VATIAIPKGDKRGNIVVKFSPTGKVLLTLGTPGRAGRRAPITSPRERRRRRPRGDVFIADGHGETGNNRIARLLEGWRIREGVGEDRVGAGRIPIDSCRSRWTRVDGSSSAIAATTASRSSIRTAKVAERSVDAVREARAASRSTRGTGIYVADSESAMCRIPGGKKASALVTRRADGCTSFILFPWANPRTTAGNGAEVSSPSIVKAISTAASRRRSALQKYVRVRPLASRDLVSTCPLFSSMGIRNRPPSGTSCLNTSRVGTSSALSPPGLVHRSLQDSVPQPTRTWPGWLKSSSRSMGPSISSATTGAAGHVLRVAMERPDLIRFVDERPSRGVFDPEYEWHTPGADLADPDRRATCT